MINYYPGGTGEAYGAWPRTWGYCGSGGDGKGKSKVFYQESPDSPVVEVKTNLEQLQNEKRPAYSWQFELRILGFLIRLFFQAPLGNQR